ncbi:unnamed protein product [Rotaria sp. Silwood2]|nr:unnamed protein product [Rotaria sp. Silwood2]
MHSSINNSSLKVAPYYYNDGTSKDLLCLVGTISVPFNNGRCNIPLEIWLQTDHPLVAPLVYVTPPSNMFISSKTGNVKQDGLVILSYLKLWNHPTSNLSALFQAIFESFSESSPIFTKTSSDPVTLPSSTVSSSTEKSSESLLNPSLSTTSSKFHYYFIDFSDKFSRSIQNM